MSNKLFFFLVILILLFQKALCGCSNEGKDGKDGDKNILSADVEDEEACGDSPVCAENCHSFFRRRLGVCKSLVPKYFKVNVNDFQNVCLQKKTIENIDIQLALNYITKALKLTSTDGRPPFDLIRGTDLWNEYVFINDFSSMNAYCNLKPERKFYFAGLVADIEKLKESPERLQRLQRINSTGGDVFLRDLGLFTSYERCKCDDFRSYYAENKINYTESQNIVQQTCRESYPYCVQRLNKAEGDSDEDHSLKSAALRVFTNDYNDAMEKYAELLQKEYESRLREIFATQLMAEMKIENKETFLAQQQLLDAILFENKAEYERKLNSIKDKIIKVIENRLNSATELFGMVQTPEGCPYKDTVSCDDFVKKILLHLSQKYTLRSNRNSLFKKGIVRERISAWRPNIDGCVNHVEYDENIWKTESSQQVLLISPLKVTTPLCPKELNRDEVTKLWFFAFQDTFFNPLTNSTVIRTCHQQYERTRYLLKINENTIDVRRIENKLPYIKCNYPINEISTTSKYEQGQCSKVETLRLSNQQIKDGYLYDSTVSGVTSSCSAIWTNREKAKLPSGLTESQIQTQIQSLIQEVVKSNAFYYIDSLRKTTRIASKKGKKLNIKSKVVPPVNGYADIIKINSLFDDLQTRYSRSVYANKLFSLLDLQKDNLLDEQNFNGLVSIGNDLAELEKLKREVSKKYPKLATEVDALLNDNLKPYIEFNNKLALNLPKLLADLQTTFNSFDALIKNPNFKGL